VLPGVRSAWTADRAWVTRAVLLGRDQEVKLLEGVLSNALDGEAGFVMVEGEAGIGKTTLLEELAHVANERGCLTLEGRASEFDQGLPFGLFTDALDAYLDSLDPQAMGRLAMDRLGALAAVFLLGGLGGAGSLVQGRWVRSSSCGVTWSLEFQAFGSLQSVEYTYDGSCFLLTAEPDSGSWSSEDAGDHVYAYFWDVYRATVYKSTPNEMTVHKFDYQGSAIGSWSFVRP